MKNSLFYYFLFILPLNISCSSLYSQEQTPKALFTPCSQDKQKYEERSLELQAIVKADQDERQNFMQFSSEDMQKLAIRDSARRERVGAIFGEGCFKEAKDYAAAALVFQHGGTSDHYYQTFIWTKRAVELGDLKQKYLMAMSIDRYLVSIGHKQLFGSQAFKFDECWCLQGIEKSFPEEIRRSYMDTSKKKQFSWLKELNKGTSCPNIECSTMLKDTPKGTLPEFW